MQKPYQDNAVPLTVVPDKDKILYLVQRALFEAMPARRADLDLTRADLARKIFSTETRIETLEDRRDDMGPAEAYSILEALDLEIKVVPKNA